MRYEANDQDRRRERAYEGFGTRTPACTAPGCPETDWRRLTGSEPAKLLCYEHEAETAGRSPVERQHPAGRRNDPTFVVPMLGNLHRLMDEDKRDWPERTLRNPEGSPMLKAAACVRAVADWLRLIIERLLGWVPTFLEAVDAAFTERHGPRWWETLGLAEGLVL